MKNIFISFTTLLSFSTVAAFSFDVQGHRGARGLYPENTLPAFEAAIEAGVDTLELDLQVTQDGEIVIHHDYFLWKAGCCSHKKMDPSLLIKSLNLSEIKEQDYGIKKNCCFPRAQQIPGTRVPTLDELMTLIENSSHPNASHVVLNLEIKRDAENPQWSISPQELAEKIVSKVEQRGFGNRVYYSSFDPEVLAKVREYSPEAKLGFIFGKVALEKTQQQYPGNPMDLLLQIANFLQVSVISPEQGLVQDPNIVRQLQESGFKIIPWTANDEETWARLIDLGVDGIITDYPHDLLYFLIKRGLK